MDAICGTPLYRTYSNGLACSADFISIETFEGCRRFLGLALRCNATYYLVGYIDRDDYILDSEAA